MQFHLPPSTIVFNEALGEVDEHLEFRSVLAIEGPPQIGKTTFLQTIGARAHKRGLKYFWVQIKEDMEILQFFKLLYETFGISWPKSKHRIDTIQSTFSTLLNSKQITILIDDFDRVKGFENLVSRFACQLNVGKLVFCCKSIAKIESDFLFDIGIHELNGFKSEDTAIFLNQSRLQVQGNPEPIYERITELTGGQPHLIKKLFAQYFRNRTAINLTNIDSTLRETLTNFSEKLIEDLGRREFEELLIAATIKSYHSLSSKILAKFTESHPNFLDAGIIRKEYHYYELNDEARKIIETLRNPSETPSIHAKILKLCQKSDRYDAQIESIYQLLAAGDKRSATTLFENKLQELWENHDVKKIEEFGLKCFDEISLRNKCLVMRALVDTRPDIDPSDLFESFSMDIRTIDDKLQALQTYALLREFNVRHFPKLWEEILQTYPRESDEYWCAKFQKIRQYSEAGHSDRLVVSRKEVEEIENLQVSALSKARIYYCHAVNLFNQDFKSRTKSVNWYLKAASYYKKAGDRFEEARCLSIAGSASYWVGNIQESRICFESAKKLSKENSILHVLARINGHEVAELANRGLLSRASEKRIRFRTQHKDLTDFNTNISASEIHDFSGLVEIKLDQLLFTDAYKLTSQLTANQYFKRGTQRKPFIENTHRALGFLLQNGLTKPNVLTHVDDIKTQPPTDQILIIILYLSINRYLGMPMDLTEVVDHPLAKDTELNDFYRQVFLPYYRAINLVSLNREKEAKIYFTRSFDNAYKLGFDYWICRSLLYLSMLEIKRKNYTSARTKLTYIDENLHKFDPFEEFDLRFVAKAMLNLKEGKVEEAKEQLAKIPRESPNHYFSVLFNKMTPEIEPKVNCIVPEHQERFFDKLADLMGFERARVFEVVTNETKVNVPEDELEHFMLDHDFDAVFDASRGCAYFGREKVTLETKPVMYRMIELFVKFPGKLFTKEQLAGIVWEENYNPLVHDQRIYTNITRLRQALKAMRSRDWVVAKEGTYGSQRALRYAKIGIPRSDDPQKDWILRFAKKNGHITRDISERYLKISSTYAKNKLRSLVEQGELQVVGKGRAVRYEVPVG